MDLTEAIEHGCIRMVEAIQNTIGSDVPPPNAPSTILKKGHGMTLRDTFAYMDSINYEIYNDNTAEVGVFDPEIMTYVWYNEMGTPRIPSRPAIRIAFDTYSQEIADEMLEIIGDKVVEMFLQI